MNSCASSRHELCLAAVAIVPPAEPMRSSVMLISRELVIATRMGVAAEIGQHLLWPAEGRLGGEQAAESIRFCQMGEIAEEAQPALIMRRSQLLQKEAAKQARQHAHGQKRTPTCMRSSVCRRERYRRPVRCNGDGDGR